MPKLTAPSDDPPVLPYRSEPSALSSAKRRLSRMVDAELDELTATDALDLLDWLHDDAATRRIETEGDGPCAAAR